MRFNTDQEVIFMRGNIPTVGWVCAVIESKVMSGNNMDNSYMKRLFPAFYEYRNPLYLVRVDKDTFIELRESELYVSKEEMLTQILKSMDIEIVSITFKNE